MKKIFTLVCAAVIAVSAMNAEVLLKESFANTKDSLTTVYNYFGDEIASSGWSGISGSGFIGLNSTDLTYADYKTATDGTGSAEFLYNKVRKAATPLSKSVNSGSIYVAAILNLENYSTTSATASTRDYLWALVNGTSGVSTAGNHFCRLQMQKIADNQFQFGIAKQAESAAFISYTETYEYGKFLLVTEYEFVSGDQNDIVRLYVNPAKGDKPAATIECKQSFINPNTSADVGSGTKPDAAQLKTILLNSSSTLKLAAHLDELKVVTDWSDLWEAGEAPQTPTIIADQSFSFGNVNVNEAANQNLTIKGSNLKGAISIASNNAQLVVSAASVTKEAAEAEEGAAVSLTLTATAAGEGSAKITLSSEDAADKVINVTWNAVAPMPSAENIAAIASLTEGEPSVLATQPIVVGSIDGIWVLQDATGAFIYNEYGMCELAIGDKLEKVVIQRIAEEDYTRGFITAYAYDFPTKVSSGNAISPIETNIANMNDLGPAIIKLTEVEFTDLDKNEFAKGWFNIKQGDNTARIQVPENCDIIGEAIPAKADVVGQLVYTTGGIAISSSANLTNRVPRSATAIENIQSTGKAVKVVRNGQLIILRDGKEYNVLGAEK